MTAPNEYEPSAEAVEAEAQRISDSYYKSAGSVDKRDRPISKEWPAWRSFCRAEARFVLRRQHEREEGLTYAMGRALKSLEANFDHPSWAVAYLTEALTAHAKLDAPKVPTLLEAAKAHVEAASRCCTGDAVTYAALKAAVEREERK